MYVTVIQEGVRLKNQLRICPECLTDIQAHYGKQWTDGFLLGHYTAETACHGCGELRGDDGRFSPMYVVCYDAAGKQYKYFATYCPACTNAEVNTWALTNGN